MGYSVIYTVGYCIHGVLSNIYGRLTMVCYFYNFVCNLTMVCYLYNFVCKSNDGLLLV